MLGEPRMLGRDLAGYFGPDVPIRAVQQAPYILFVQFLIHGGIPIGIFSACALCAARARSCRLPSERRVSSIPDFDSSRVCGRKKWEQSRLPIYFYAGPAAKTRHGGGRRAFQLGCGGRNPLWRPPPFIL
jgi:hypothetical protein